MPDDRFGDIGERRSAAERLAELDARPEPGGEGSPSQKAPPPARPGSRYSWVVGVAALVLIIVATYNTLFVGEAGEGFQGLDPGTPAPEFAAPTPGSDLEGDANVIQSREGTDSGVPPACEVRGAGVVTVCGAPLRPLAVTFVTTGCEEALDVVEDVRGDFPGVRFVAVYSNESPEEIGALARGRWGFEIAVDPDRPEIFNLYRAGDCPTTVLVEQGGDVRRTLLGPRTEDELRTSLERLVSGRRAGEGSA